MKYILLIAFALVFTSCGSGSPSSNGSANESRPSSTLGPTATASAPGQTIPTHVVTVEDFHTDPSYPQFQSDLANGIKKIQREASARGGLYSGRTLKELSRLVYDLAKQDSTFYQFRLNESRDTIEPFATGGLGWSDGNFRDWFNDYIATLP